jgi:hypothetical protein
MTCPAWGGEERQDREAVVPTVRPLTLHPRGHAWHMPLVIRRTGSVPSVAATYVPAGGGPRPADASGKC